ncbi:MAG: MBL fold metallo-hydrolase, partial [Clostridia bacterium]|nr:MBL fold metallo-hydrolase [Clostridia bacterium]
VRKIRGYGINSIETLVLTHSHSDHIGSAEYILSTLKVENVVLPEFKSDETQENKSLKDLNDAVSKSNAQKYIATQGMVINTGDIEFTVLQSDANQPDINNRSTVLMAKFDDKKFLFMADLEAEGEEQLIDNKINFDCDVLKVGHHGSKTSTTAEFLEIATPQISAISVGSNSYGHPADSVIDSLKQAGSQVFRTDRHGDIVFTVENGIIKVN